MHPVLATSILGHEKAVVIDWQDCQHRLNCLAVGIYTIYREAMQIINDFLNVIPCFVCIGKNERVPTEKVLSLNILTLFTIGFSVFLSQNTFGDPIFTINN